MRPFYSSLLAVLALAALAQPARAQDDVCPTSPAECVVEWFDGGDVNINALRNAVANDADRPADRVYVLRRGGYYWNEDAIENTDFDLVIRGETAEEGAASGQNVCGASGTEDCGPAVIQRIVRGDGSVDAMIRSGGSGGQHLMNVWLMGQDNTGITGFYEPIVINSENARFTYDNVIFDRNDWHHLGVKSGGNSFYVRNSHFRNLVGNTQRYEGRAIRLEAGADTVMFENNSFFNITSFPFQSEAAPVDYFVFNHNTVINFGLAFNAGGIWQQAYVANNVWVNPFWQGESADQYNGPNRTDPYSSIFGIANLPAAFGFNSDRRILLANNTYGRAAEINTHYGTISPDPVRPQPLVNDTTQGWFDAFPDGMKKFGNLDVIPNFASAPLGGAVYDAMKGFITAAATAAPTPWPLVVWDPGRSSEPIDVNWPLPEDFSYSDANLQTAGTDGLPLGDLNWFPAAKADYEANREDYLQDLVDNFDPIEEVLVAPILQAEGQTINDGATVVEAGGFTSFFMESSGFIEWTFDLPADGEYGYNILTNLRGSDPRGQNFLLNGSSTNSAQTQEGFGEVFFCTAAWSGGTCWRPLPDATNWHTLEVRPADIISGSLAMNAGTNTLRIVPSWGFQAFSTVEIVDASENVVATLTPPDATTSGVAEECEDAEAYCPQGFKAVDLAANGSVTFSVTIPDGAMSMQPYVTYTSASGGSGEILIDGASVGTLAFAATEAGAAATVSGPRVNVSPGVHTVTITSNTGGVSLDYGQFASYEGGVVAVEELPEGWALGNSFPNPTAGTATIRFALGEAADVRLDVFDVLGRRVATLADGLLAAGPHEARLDTRGLASGTYVYRFTTPVGLQSRRLTIVR